MEKENSTALMDWNINTLGRTCSVSAQPLAVGDRVICFIYRDAQGQVQRADVVETESEQYTVPGDLLGRWGRVVKPRGEEAREAREQALASAEELFMSLFEQSADGAQAERDTFKLVLALYLERKRIVRRQGREDAEGFQEYLHVKTKQTFHVPMDDPQPALLLALQTQLEMLLV